MERLVIHSLTSEHQNRTMNSVRNITSNIYCSDLSSTSTASIGPELEEEEEDDTTVRVSDNRGDDMSTQSGTTVLERVEELKERETSLTAVFTMSNPTKNVECTP